MYEERRNSFSFKDIILQLLLVILFVFIMIWLFPTKNYLKENFVGKDELSSEIAMQLEGLYGRLFTDNIESMRDAAEGYFTNERLPKNIGDSVTLTLDEMLENKLVLAFKDSNNKTCNVNNSYVQVTKMNDEYQMKVQLSCSDYEDYIIVYMGCYDYCDSDVCVKEETTTKPTTKPSKPSEPSTPSTPVSNKKYEYEYRLVTQNTYSDWGPWSKWSTNKVTSDILRQVEIDKRNELVRYETETYYVYENHTEYKTETVQVQVGTKDVVTGTKTDTKPAISTGGSTTKQYTNPIKNTTSGGYGSWVYRGTVSSSYALSSSDTTRYEYQSHKTTVDCTNVCKNVTTYVYKKYTRTYNSGSTTYSCPTGYIKEGSGASTKCYKNVTTTSKLSCASYGSGYTLSGTNCIKTTNVTTKVPVYKDETITVPETVTERVAKTRKVPIYENITYYRYRVREQLTEAGVKYKWSTSKADKSLLALGYELTGNKREV